MYSLRENPLAESTINMTYIILGTLRIGGSFLLARKLRAMSVTDFHGTRAAFSIIRHLARKSIIDHVHRLLHLHLAINPDSSCLEKLDPKTEMSRKAYHSNALDS